MVMAKQCHQTLNRVAQCGVAACLVLLLGELLGADGGGESGGPGADDEDVAAVLVALLLAP